MSFVQWLMMRPSMICKQVRAHRTTALGPSFRSMYGSGGLHPQGRCQCPSHQQTGDGCSGDGTQTGLTTGGPETRLTIGMKSDRPNDLISGLKHVSGQEIHGVKVASQGGLNHQNQLLSLALHPIAYIFAHLSGFDKEKICHPEQNPIKQK